MAEGADDECFWLAANDPNRVLAEWTRTGALEARLARDTSRAPRGIDVLAVLVVELDDFEDVRDLYDKHVADQVLAVTIQRLTAVRGATAYHLNDEIFVVVARSLGSRFDALAVADRIHRRISQPFAVQGCAVALSASIGVRVSLDGARDPAELVPDAAFALAKAKRRGRGETALFGPRLRNRLAPPPIG